MAADRTTSARDSEQAIAAALQRYRVMANVVGVLLILLICVAVPLKYFGGHARAGRRPRHRARLAVRPVLPLRRRPGAAGEVDPQGVGAHHPGRHRPFLSFYAERNATRKTRAGVRV